MKIKYKKVSVFGASKMGLCAAKVLKKNGAQIFISEKKNIKTLEKELEFSGYSFEVGKNSEKILDCELIIKSPGIPPDHFILEKAIKRKIPVIGEIDFALSLLPKDIKIISVTGSNGKTTTCHLLKEVLAKAGLNSVLCGHRNTPLSEVVLMKNKPKIIIQEVSCADLRDNKKINPDIAILLNIHDDHLDQFKTMHEYVAIKFSLFKNITETSQIIINEPAYFKWGNLLNVKNIPVLFNSKISGNLKVSNYFRGFEENISAVITISKLLNLNENIVQETINSFISPPHRREVLDIPNSKNLTFINDAKGTNPLSLFSALTWINKPCVLIAGGRDKNVDLSLLSLILKKKVKVLCAIGTTGKKLIEMTKKEKFATFDFTSDTFENALHKALDVTEKDDIILFSPGASSDNSDFYSSEECGNYFNKMAIEYAKTIN